MVGNYDGLVLDPRRVISIFTSVSNCRDCQNSSGQLQTHQKLASRNSVFFSCCRFKNDRLWHHL